MTLKGKSNIRGLLKREKSGPFVGLAVGIMSIDENHWINILFETR